MDRIKVEKLAKECGLKPEFFKGSLVDIEAGDKVKLFFLKKEGFQFGTSASIYDLKEAKDYLNQLNKAIEFVEEFKRRGLK